MKLIRTLTPMIALAAAACVAFATLSYAQSNDQSAAPTSETAATQLRQITIWRDPSCGCCDAYAEYLEENNFDVTRIDDRDFDKRSVEVGVPAQGLGCHLAEIDGYYVSGLVPVEIIDRLTAERPDIVGITLPGMPGNAPGMASAKFGTLKTYSFGVDGIATYSNE